MLLDLVLFLPLAILTNTFFPMPFDPVLLYFASRHSMQASLWFAVLGSVCAGLAGCLDVAMGHTVGRTLRAEWLRWLPVWRGNWFYLATVVFAIAPLPFSVVRLAAMRAIPDASIYGVAIAAGRLPRYVLIVYFCQGLSMPPWFSTLVVLLVLMVAAFRITARTHHNAAEK
jgi:membrane protein YqaA with SNARE-associated domain